MSHYDLTIHLDPPYQLRYVEQHIFSPGENVSGKVVLTLRGDKKIDRIFIEFKGKCYVRDNGGENERTHGLIIFGLSQELFRRPFKLASGVHQYPFSFRFPRRFRLLSKEFCENRLFEANNGLLPLPPSVEKQWGQASGICEIYYHLTAKILRTFGNWEDKISLPFHPFRKEFDPDPVLMGFRDSTTFHRNYRLTPQGIPRPFTRGEAMKHAFHRHSSTQTVNFSLSAVVPTAIVIGRPNTLEVTVIPITSDVWENSPGFRLKHYSLILKASTFIRVPSKSSETTAAQNQHITLSSGIIDIPAALNKPIRLNGMFPSNPAAYPPPTFTSFSARRTYSLELKMTVLCLDERSNFKIKWPAVELYPFKMEPGIEDAMRAIEDRTRLVGLDDQNVLPSYAGRMQSESAAEAVIPPAYTR